MRKLIPFLLVLTAPALAPAFDLYRTNAYELVAGQTVTGQLVLLTDHALLAGTAEDDLFALSRGLTAFTGECRGDAWVMAGQANLGGRMLDHVRAISQSLVVSGDLERSLLALGSTVHLATGSVVRGDLLAVGENVVLEGTVGGDATIMAQSVTLSGVVEGNARVIAQDIVVMPGTLLAGDLAYTSPKEIFLDSRVQLGGTLKRIQPTGASEAASSLSVESLLMLFLQMVGALLVGIPFAALFPRALGRATKLVRFNTVRSMMAGLAALFLLPIMAIAAAITLVGLPLGLLTAGFAGALLYLGKIVVALVLGGLILRRRGSQSLGIVATAMALGLLVVYGAFAVPVVGDSLALLVAITGSGALWWSVLRGEGRHEPPPVPPGTDVQP